jgi:hypothetical protein
MSSRRPRTSTANQHRPLLRVQLHRTGTNQHLGRAAIGGPFHLAHFEPAPAMYRYVLVAGETNQHTLKDVVLQGVVRISPRAVPVPTRRTATGASPGAGRLICQSCRAGYHTDCRDLDRWCCGGVPGWWPRPDDALRVASIALDTHCPGLRPRPRPDPLRALEDTAASGAPAHRPPSGPHVVGHHAGRAGRWQHGAADLGLGGCLDWSTPPPGAPGRSGLAPVRRRPDGGLHDGRADDGRGHQHRHPRPGMSSSCAPATARCAVPSRRRRAARPQREGQRCGNGGSLAPTRELRVDAARDWPRL